MGEQTLSRDYVEAAKRAMMLGTPADSARLEWLKCNAPKLYHEVMMKAKEEYKEAEKIYLSLLDEPELKFYWAEPFGRNPRGEYPGHTANLMVDFADILNLLNLTEGASVLDIGCGSGWVAIFLAKVGYKVTAIDISEDRIEIAKLKARSYQVDVEFLVQDAETCAYHEQFDAVVFHGTLHHIVDEKQVLQRCFKTLRDGAKLLIMEPGEMHSKSPLALDAVRTYGTIEKGISSDALERLLHDTGFRKVTRYSRYRCTFDERLPSLIWHLARMISSRARYRKQGVVILAEK